MIAIDLHTHSQASPDGSLTIEDYRRMLANGPLDVIAVTDHNRIDFARELHDELGEQIIVGEEITTTSGEVIGLYLQTAVPAGLPLAQAVSIIHQQGGLVYIPHPFETVRQGISPQALAEIANQVDIIEIYNGRSLQQKAPQAQVWQRDHTVVGAASSDAHGRRGWGKTYSILDDKPTKATLMGLLETAQHSQQSSGVIGRLYPKLNRLRKHF
ncbi:MAG: PHP domain-containing protein [Candidatus Saccharimonadales bacterium]